MTSGRGMDRSEMRIVWAIIAFAMIVSSIPFFVGMFFSFPDHRFVGHVYNIDDYLVYVSWTRQIADGHFFIRDLFTNQPQLGKTVNFYFLLMGWIVRLMHIPIPWVIELTGLAGGVALLRLIYQLYALMLPGSRAGRMIGFTLGCLGTGLGWIWTMKWYQGNVFTLPIDTWQPEAFTFMSLVTSPLFVVGTLLIVGAIYFLLLGEQTGRMRYAVYAGICGLVVANIHSYDIIHIIGAWGLFLAVRDIAARKFRGDSWARAIVAGLISVPTVAYQYYLLKHDPVFLARERVATTSMPPDTYIYGYGVTLLLAVIGGVLTFSSKRFAAIWRDRESLLLPISWIVAAFVLVYLPTSIQRKMIMGIDIPLALLAGAALAYLTAHLSSPARFAAVGLAVALCLPTGGLFIFRDVRHLMENRSETSSIPYLAPDEIHLLDWLAANTRPSDSILGPPNLMIYVPGYADRAVWSGHWGETPDFQGKYSLYGKFNSPATPDTWRRQFLATARPNYLVAINGITFPPLDASVPYLRPVYANEAYTVYRVDLSAVGAVGASQQPRPSLLS